MPDAYIFDAVRTPRGRGKDNGSLYTVRPIDLLAKSLVALRDRNSLDTSQVDDVVIGCVTQTGDQGACIARFGPARPGRGISRRRQPGRSDLRSAARPRRAPACAGRGGAPAGADTRKRAPYPFPGVRIPRCALHLPLP